MPPSAINPASTNKAPGPLPGSKVCSPDIFSEGMPVRSVFDPFVIAAGEQADDSGVICQGLAPRLGDFSVVNLPAYKSFVFFSRRWHEVIAPNPAAFVQLIQN